MMDFLIPFYHCRIASGPYIWACVCVCECLWVCVCVLSNPLLFVIVCYEGDSFENVTQILVVIAFEWAVM